MDNISRLANNLSQNVGIFQGLCQTDQVLLALEGLASMQALIAVRSAIKRDVGEAGCAIFGKVSDCTGTINDLTLDLRILAINAQVQAANTKDQQVVEALARSMRGISNAIRKDAENLTQDMRAITNRLSVSPLGRGSLTSSE